MTKVALFVASASQARSELEKFLAGALPRPRRPQTPVWFALRFGPRSSHFRRVSRRKGRKAHLNGPSRALMKRAGELLSEPPDQQVVCSRRRCRLSASCRGLVCAFV